MSINITTRLAKFEDLVPSTIPFVEGKLKGHQDRKNYSVIGPGVSEDAKQNVKIAEAHGFNIGAVSAAPMNGSGLHSHTTAEVFIIHSGAWRFYWGVDGTEGEVILYKGDVASFPTNMFRGFQNVSDEEALMFVVLGENDPGVITWTPKLLKEAKKSGMVLLDDNSLIDTEKNKIADALKPFVQKLKPKNPALKIFDAGMGDGSLLVNVMRQCHQKMPNIPLLVSTKEISMEDVRLGLEKLPDRFAEHKNTVFVISNLNYVESTSLKSRNSSLIVIKSARA